MRKIENKNSCDDGITTATEREKKMEVRLLVWAIVHSDLIIFLLK